MVALDKIHLRLVEIAAEGMVVLEVAQLVMDLVVAVVAIQAAAAAADVVVILLVAAAAADLTITALVRITLLVYGKVTVN